MLRHSSSAMLLFVQTYIYVVLSLRTALLYLFTMMSPSLTSIHKYLETLLFMFTKLPLLLCHSPADIVLSNLQRAPHTVNNIVIRLDTNNRLPGCL